MPVMNYKTPVAASLISIALPSFAFARCTECAMYPDRDPLNKGAQTPAGKMGIVQPGGAVAPPNAAPITNTANTVNNPSDARAEIRGQSPQRSGRGIGLNGNRAKKDFRSPDSRSR
jgi:hypothetical protein